MVESLYINSEVDPGDLGVNLRFKGSQVIHPRARAAQNQLISDIKDSVEDGYKPCSSHNGCSMSIIFSFLSNRFDIDGPVKRTMDAVEKALKQLGYDWNDRRVEVLRVRKLKMTKPGITISMVPLGED